MSFYVQYLLTFVFISLYYVCEGNPKNCPVKESFKPCTCDYEGINCNLVKSDIELKRAFEVRPQGDNRFRTLWIINSPLNKIAPYTFKDYAFKQMQIEDNQITSIGEGAFIGSAEFLLVLTLNNNELSEIPITGLKGLKRLAQLRLMNNKITSIPDNAFEEFPTLAAVILANNKITKIGSRAFAALSNLFELNLSNNQLTYIGDDTFYNPSRTAFRFVNFASNQISSVSAKAFNGANSMGQFILVANQLDTLDKSAFTPFISLMNNGMAGLHLSGNPIKCDLGLLWLLNYTVNIKARITGLNCNGKPLTSMIESDLV